MEINLFPSVILNAVCSGSEADDNEMLSVTESGHLSSGIIDMFDGVM